LALTLVVVETQAIHQDHVSLDAKAAEARLEDNERFEAILKNNQAHFAKTMQSTKSILQEARNVNSAVTGGKSFCYVQSVFDQPKSEVFFTLTLDGTTPLRNVDITLYDVDKATKLFGGPLGIVAFSADTETKVQSLYTTFPMLPSLSKFDDIRPFSRMSLQGLSDRKLRFEFVGLNGGWIQSIEFRRIKGTIWVQGFTVVGPKGKKLLTYADPGFPLTNGLPNW
jgi:hypothetical protein